MTSSNATTRLQARTIQITATRGYRGAARRLARQLGASMHYGRLCIPALAGERAETLIEAARWGLLRLATPAAAPASTARVPAAAYPIRVLARACTRGAGYTPRSRMPVAARARLSADDAVQAILDRVGPAGEQALADEQRYFASRSDEWETKRGTIGRDERAVSRAWVRPDGSAAIIAFVEWGAWGQTSARSDTGSPRGGLHHLRIEAYLVVRDSTTGERHTIRVPPRFGRTAATLRGMGWREDDVLGASADGERLCSIYDYSHGARPGSYGVPADIAAEARIHAAVAWTFGLRPAEYRPDVEA